MSGAENATSVSLQRWHGGDRGALDDLLARHLPWIEAHVRRRLGPMLRSRGDTVDYVQDAMSQFLRFGPRFTITRDEDFRALLARIVENALRNKSDWFKARRRDIARERPLPSDTVLSLDRAQGTVRTPSVSAEKNEREAWIRLGMELLDPEQREVLVLRQWEQLPFAEMGERLGTTADAARMRHNHAVRKLGEKVQLLRDGRLSDALAEKSA